MSVLSKSFRWFIDLLERWLERQAEAELAAIEQIWFNRKESNE